MARIDQGDIADDETQPGYTHDDTPDEIKEFLASNGIGKKFQCIVKEVIPGGGMGVLETMNNRYPDIDEIGKHWGPGDYQLLFSWTVPKPGGGREKGMKPLDLHFPERAWRDIHEKWLEERNAERKRQRAADLEKARQEAELKNIEAGGQAAPSADPLDALQKALETAKKLGIPIGGAADKASKPIDIMGIAALITAMAPLLKGLFGGDRGNDSAILLKSMEAQQATNMLLMKTLLESRSGGDANSPHVDKILNMTMGAMGRVLEMQDMLKPAEKETLVDRIFGAVDRFLPNILELAKVSKDVRERDMMYKLAANSNEMKQARANPDVALALVNKWDAFYGFQTTNEILKVAGIERPAGTSDNMVKYPSDGYGPDGQKLGTAPMDADTSDVPTGESPAGEGDGEGSE